MKSGITLKSVTGPGSSGEVCMQVNQLKEHLLRLNCQLARQSVQKGVSVSVNQLVFTFFLYFLDIQSVSQSRDRYRTSKKKNQHVSQSVGRLHSKFQRIDTSDTQIIFGNSISHNHGALSDIIYSVISR